MCSFSEEGGITPGDDRLRNLTLRSELPLYRSRIYEGALNVDGRGAPSADTAVLVETP